MADCNSPHSTNANNGNGTDSEYDLINETKRQIQMMNKFMGLDDDDDEDEEEKEEEEDIKPNVKMEKREEEKEENVQEKEVKKEVKKEEMIRVKDEEDQDVDIEGEDEEKSEDKELNVDEEIDSDEMSDEEEEDPTSTEMEVDDFDPVPGPSRSKSSLSNSHHSSFSNISTPSPSTQGSGTTDSSTPQNSPSMLRSKKDSTSEKRAFNQRRNIKPIIQDEELDPEVLNARREEEERLKRLMEAQQRQREMILQQQQLQQQQQQSNQQWQQVPGSSSRKQTFPSSKSSGDEIVLSSDEDEPSSKNDQPRPATSSRPRPRNGEAEMIELSDGEEDSNDMTSSERGMLKGAALIPDNGLHTDDRFNIPDAHGRVLVNVAHPDEDPDVFLSPFLSGHVKSHQIGGVRFLYDCIIESLDKYNTSPGLGCILAHSMGLGKTLQTITFIEIFLRVTSAKHVLCIVPINTLQNWLAEFDQWFPPKPIFNNQDTEEVKAEEESENEGKPCSVGKKYRNFSVFSLGDCKSNSDRAREVIRWRKDGGVLFLGYEMYRILSDEKHILNSIQRSGSNISENQAYNIVESIRKALLDPGPDLMICDEGHRIKNAKAAISKTLKQIRTKRRIVLTGYPLQNNLLEYWCMVDFIRPGYLGTRQEFGRAFEKPITNGQCVNSNPEDKILMRKRAHVLYQLLKGFVQRRSHNILTQTLPQKYEYVIYVRMSDIQKRLFVAYFNYLKEALEGSKRGQANPLVVFSVCVRIWNHPDIFYAALKENDLNPDIDMEMPTQMESNGCGGPDIKTGGGVRKKGRPRRQVQDQNMFEGDPADGITGNAVLSNLFHKLLDTSWATSLMGDYVPGFLNNGYKMSILFDILEETIQAGDRMLVFSHSLKTLDVIEQFLSERNVPGQQERFQKFINYFRLDGSTGPQERERLINNFNKNSTIKLFLLSTRAGSLGINLIGANRIVVFDASWNPCHDAQAACRIYRFGQKKRCYIYRLVCDNTLEKRIYDRQVTKQGLSNRVVDELNSDSFLTSEELSRLVDGLDDINEPPVIIYSPQEIDKFGDDMMKRLCSRFSHYMTKQPFEHESLLLDVEETKLSLDEKRMAEIEFKLERSQGYRINTSMGPSAAGESIIQPGGAPSMEMAPNYQYHQPPMPSQSKFDYRTVRLMDGVMHPAAGQMILQCIVPNNITILDINEQMVTLNRGQVVMYYSTPAGLIILKTLNNRIIPLHQHNFIKYFGYNPLGQSGPMVPIIQNHAPAPPVGFQRPRVDQNGQPEVIDLSSDEDGQ